MAVREVDTVLNFKTNGEVNYSKTIKEINREMNLAATEYKNQVSAMDKDATATEKLTAAKKKLENQLSLAEKRTELLREQYEKSVEETGKYSKESENLYKKMLESETGQNKLKSALEQTNDALKEQGDLSIDTAKKLQKIEEAGEKVSGVGKKMSVGITAPVVAAGAAGLAAFSEVDEALDTITTKTGATGDKADQLAQSFENVGSNTHLPLQTVGEAIGEVNTQFGFMDKQLEDSTNYLLQYAEINDTDVSQSAISARQAIEAYGLKYTDLNSVLDVTTKTAQDTGQSVDDLMQKAIDGAPQIKQLGLSFGEGVTLMGKFEQSGVDSGAALSSLSKATVAYAKDGKSLSEGLGELQDKIKNASSETEAINAAAEIFGTKGGPRMADAIRRGTLNLEDLAKIASESNGAVGETFEATQDPIDKSNQAMNNAKLALADVGESIQISLLPFFEMAIDALKSFKSWWDSLDQGTKNWIITIAGVAAAVGPVLVVLGTLMSSVTKIINGIRAVQAVWTGLTTLLAANPFILVIAGIALLIAGLVMAYKKFEWFRDGVNGTLNFIKDVFVGTFNAIGSIVKESINWLIGMINEFIGLANRIKIPKGIPIVGGKGINIAKIPYLATGGHVLNGQAIVGEAGPELLTSNNGKTTVTPLSDEEKRQGINGKINGNTSVSQTINIGNVDANNPSELDRLNRKFAKAAKMANAFG